MTTRSLVEIFGYAPHDHSAIARQFWALSACPFIGKACSKYDHSNSICYGTCAVSNAGKNVVICPSRLYADNYATIRAVSADAFGDLPFMLFEEYLLKLQQGKQPDDFIVALGQNSGKEVKLAQMSMDWVLARITQGKLSEYIGIEVQSIDITGNYRDAWYAAKEQKPVIQPSEHGLNWANVHKRLIPQVIRKGRIYSRSELVRRGLYFIVPEPVYQKFEDVIGQDIPLENEADKDTITVHTYDLGPEVATGEKRNLIPTRALRFKLDEFSKRFIDGPNLPESSLLDNKIREILACQ